MMVVKGKGQCIVKANDMMDVKGKGQCIVMANGMMVVKGKGQCIVTAKGMVDVKGKGQYWQGKGHDGCQGKRSMSCHGKRDVIALIGSVSVSRHDMYDCQDKRSSEVDW